MRILVAEDDLASRRFLTEFLSKYGTCDQTMDGIETLDAFLIAWDEGKPYDLICLDIMMPKVDGLKVLKTINKFEKDKDIPKNQKSKIILVTALSPTTEIATALSNESVSYLAKPFSTEQLQKILNIYGFLNN